MALASCNGVFDSVYDELPTPAEGDLYIDASSWTQWHYIDLHAIQQSATDGQKAEVVIQTFDIPIEKSDAFDADSTGIYTYWYDVFGEGISKHELRNSYPTVRQPEPSQWDLAFHRNNVRTNNAAVWQTSFEDISQVSDHSLFITQPFVGDTWNNLDVWTVQDRMLQGLVGNQKIKINSELGKWLRLDIPPMPPAFTHNGNVFIVRFSDGTYAALRLKNYISPSNVKCHLTIEYKYPL
ncbi:MAG: HmuY family protein [Prevotella sp.]|nr:HmuY family protein [Prevotella sp.]